MNSTDDNNQEDEAMDAASNVMETTTTSDNSSNGGSNGSAMEVIGAATAQDGSTAMEDAASTNDIVMGAEQAEGVDAESTVEMTIASTRNVHEENEEVCEEMMNDHNQILLQQEHDEVMVAAVEDEAPDEALDKVETFESEKTAEESSLSLSLHEFLSLGEIELGLEREHRPWPAEEGKSNELSNENARKLDTNLSTERHRRALSEIQRLPYVLRLLSQTRPFASMSAVVPLPYDANVAITAADKDHKQGDAVVDSVVNSLEDVAALYSAAEGIDVVMNHLAPTMTRKISRLKPLSFKRVNINGQDVVEWETSQLAEVARDPISLAKKRKSQPKSAQWTGSQPSDNGLLTSDEDPEIPDDDNNNDETTSIPLKKRKRSHRRDSLEDATADSQEATFVKIVSELTSLVVRSLEQNGFQKNSSSQDADDEPHDSGVGSLALSTDDSILSEYSPATDDDGGGAMEGSDLGSTIAAIMHYSPVLQSRHVSSAFCRASLPQTGNLLTRIAANCPATSSGLLLGCIETYAHAITCGNTSIAKTAKKGANALAGLCRSECSKVFNKLQSLDIMADIQLQLSMKLGVLETCSTVLKNLSKSICCSESFSIITTSAEKQREPRRTVSRDSSADILDEDTEELGSIAITSDERSLASHFTKNSKLYAQTLEFFRANIGNTCGGGNESRGELCLILRCLLLMLLVPIGNTSRCEEAFLGLSKALGAILYQQPRYINDLCLPKTSVTDPSYIMLTSSIILLCARALNGDNCEESRDKKEHIVDLVIEIKRLEASSKTMQQFWGSIESFMKTGATKSLFDSISTAVSLKIRVSELESCYESIQRGMKLLATSVVRKFQPIVRAEDSIQTLDALLQSIKRKDPPCNQIAVTKQSLQRLLEHDDTPSLIEKVNVWRFIADATKLVANETSSQIPFVLPTSLDILWSKIITNPTSTKSGDYGAEQSTYLLRLFYALQYFEAHPTSPFVVDVRSLPLKEVLTAVKLFRATDARDFVLSELRRLVEKDAPDVELDWNPIEKPVLATVDSMTRNDIVETLYCSIRDIVILDDDTKGDAGDQESVFTQARLCLNDADLFCTVVSAFFSFPNSPTSRFSYSLLCRDPMILFRYPLKVWRRKGLRRILLTTLRTLLLANNFIAFRDSPNSDTARELIAARDAIVIRCLLAVVHGGGTHNPCICSSTTSFIRWLVTCRPGLVGLLVKQGIQEIDIDWLVEYVPESINDSQVLVHILSQMGFSAAPEKILDAADAISRIAIVHGGDSNDHIAGQMAINALSQLIDSFYLVSGPVGVPFALLSDETGTDIIQRSRKAAFRILNSLIKVRARRKSFLGCGSGLQKLRSLCKGESAANLPQESAAGRRKILKELFDTASKATGILSNTPN